MMRPVLERLCTLRELKDGTYTINDVADFNDSLDIRDENMSRAQHAAQKAAEKR